METLGWIANILAVAGWIVNIKYRKYAMMIFTVATVLSIIYFGYTRQASFLYRMIIYLVIDIATLRNIAKNEPPAC